MFDDKNAVVFAVLLLVVLQSGVKPQLTIDSFEGESCSQSDEECRILIAENDQLKQELKRQQLLAKTLQRQQPVAINLIQTFSCRPSSRYAYGVTATLDKIYVLCHEPDLIKVFENRNQFRFLTEIALHATKLPFDIVYSDETKCLYINDEKNNCIWKMTTNDYRLTKWLTNANATRTFSLSTDGQLLKLNSGEPFSQLIIYGLDANVVRSLHLPEDIKNPQHAVKTLTGNFILSHWLEDVSTGTRLWTISQVNNAGQLIHRFIPRNQLEKLSTPLYMSLDSENNRLFVADLSNHRVIVLESISLIWRHVLLSKKTDGIDYPGSLFYDSSYRRLMVAQTTGKVKIYEV